MVRRSVTLWPRLERDVRKYQAHLLTELDRDVTFNEALNLMLLGGSIHLEQNPDWLDADLATGLLDGSKPGQEGSENEVS